MMSTRRGLSHEETVRFYDRLGARQDRQAYYEDIALDELVRHGSFEQSARVIEYGCGTGRFAQKLLADHLPERATYWGCDISTTMVILAADRLQSFEERARVWKSTGAGRLPLGDASGDRFVSTYVLDILALDEITAVIGEARRLLKPGGLLCLVSLTNGEQGLSRMVTALWKLRFALKPSLVGGCRPVKLLPFVPETEWEIVYHGIVTRRGISSEVIVGRKRQAIDTSDTI